MNADAEFLKLVREYVELTRFVDNNAVYRIEAANARRKLQVAVQEIIQRQSQPQLFSEPQTERTER